MKFFRLCLLSMTALLLVSPALRASTFDLSICSNITAASGASCPNTDSTKSVLTYTDGIKAYGYVIGVGTTDLYVKQGGTDENGLGIASEVDHEIDTTELIDLDLSALFSSGIHNVTVNLQSLQTGEGYKICQTTVASLGSLSGSCFTGSSVSATANVNVSLTSTTDILSITAFNADGQHPAADILVDSVTTPEPEVLTLFGSGLLCLGGLIRRNRKNLL